LAGCLLLLAQLAAAAASARPTSEASRAFAEGSELFDKADYVGAIEAFTRAYKLKPHYSVLCNIALSHERLGNMVAAARSYRDCLSQGADQAASAEAVRNSLRRVEGRIGWVLVRSSGKGGDVYVDGLQVGPAPQRVPLNPGSHVVEVRRPGAEAGRETLTTRGGEQLELELIPRALAPEPPKVIVVKEQAPERPRRRLHQAWFWSGVGLTAGLAAVATALGVLTLRTRDDYQAQPSRDLYDRGLNYRLLTNVFWGLTAASAGVTTGLFFYTDFRRSRDGSGRAGTELMLGLHRTF
jgi:tetratricopeptide (TPR) repeat protein